jgi:hypothetical protein
MHIIGDEDQETKRNADVPKEDVDGGPKKKRRHFMHLSMHTYIRIRITYTYKRTYASGETDKGTKDKTIMQCIQVCIITCYSMYLCIYV